MKFKNLFNCNTIYEAAMAKSTDPKYIPDIIQKIKDGERIAFCDAISGERVKFASGGDFLLGDEDIEILQQVYDGEKNGNTKLPGTNMKYSFKNIFKSPFSTATSPKALTSTQTEIKELLCILAIKGKISDPSEMDTTSEILELGDKYLCKQDAKDLSKCLNLLGDDYCAEHGYIDSAITTAGVFSQHGFDADVYDIERQRSDISRLFYDDAKKLGASKFPDNWNPADIWCISKKFDAHEYDAFVYSLEETEYPGGDESKLTAFNRYFLSMIEDRLILPISLKKISGSTGKIELMASSSLNKDVPEMQNLEPIEVDSISLMSNKSAKSVASGFRVNFTDNIGHSYFVQFWEKSNSGFTASLQQTDNSNNKSGIDKSFLIQSLDGYDDISDLYKGNTVNIENVKRIARHIKCDSPTLLETTVEYVCDPENWKVKGTFEPLGIMNKALYTIQNLNVVCSALSKDTKLIYGMLLYGLKASGGFCPHYKIY